MKTKFALPAAIVLTLALLPLDLFQSKSLAAPKADDNFELVKVADGVYAAIAKPGGLASGNAGFVIGDESVLVFDTFLTPTALNELIEVIEGPNKASNQIRRQQSLPSRSHGR